MRNEALRTLTRLETERVKVLSQRAVRFALIEPTKTGIKKSILDATGPLRTFLKSECLHDFERQSQGQDNKHQIRSIFLSDVASKVSVASLYRPITKNGDPRIWFSGLREFAEPHDIIAVLAYGGEIYLINISKADLPRIDHSQGGPIYDFLSTLQISSDAAANELLSRLKALAKQGPIPSVMSSYADTAVGRTIEAALGISMNSRSEPDYNGIELKSSRIRPSGNKHTLFAKVPDWDISNLKSSADILDYFGYTSEEDFRLYCTVSARNPNPQSLFLELDRSNEHLCEKSTRAHLRFVASWRLENLRKALREKHAETFWISVSSDRSGERESFQIRSVEHTRAPIESQFELLLEQGEITVDHLIKRSPSGRVTEGGPLFKITRRAFPLLFPPSRRYDLA